MSTNYYFRLKEIPKLNINIKGEIGNNILNKLNEKLESMSEIHICRREFYERNKDLLYIENEYGAEKSWSDIEYIINDNTGKRRYNVDYYEYSYDKDSGIEFMEGEWF